MGAEVGTGRTQPQAEECRRPPSTPQRRDSPSAPQHLDLRPSASRTVRASTSVAGSRPLPPHLSDLLPQPYDTENCEPTRPGDVRPPVCPQRATAPGGTALEGRGGGGARWGEPRVQVVGRLYPGPLGIFCRRETTWDSVLAAAPGICWGATSCVRPGPTWPWWHVGSGRVGSGRSTGWGGGSGLRGCSG